MTESPAPEHREREVHPQDGDPMPRWVPVVIGVVLVTFAALAVITGLRYRDRSLMGAIKRRVPDLRTSPAPPGEPEPGGSRVFSGEAPGANVPPANEPVGGLSHAEVTGGPGGVTAVARMWAKRGMLVKAVPADAVVYVNEIAVGEARQFDAEDEIYDFAEAGSYTVRITAPGYKEQQFIVTAADSAPNELARLEVKLEPEVSRPKRN